MFENGCYLRRQKRFKCPIRQAQKAAQRAATAAAGRLSVESGTSLSRDLNRKLIDDVTSRTPNLIDLRRLNSGTTDDGGTPQNGVAAGLRDLNRNLTDDVTSGERRKPNDDRCRFNNCVGDAGIRTGLRENQNGVGHVTYDTAISGGSYRGLNAAQSQNMEETFSSSHYRYQQHTVFMYYYYAASQQDAIGAACFCRRSSVVCISVCVSVGHVREPCKTAEPIEIPIGG